jgi:predicted ATPase with chaperone activity
MPFKTIRASVYGIDACVIEVEVDVGFRPYARLQCSVRIPSRPGVTINLASADVFKEGSAFDLPMALGLAECEPQRRPELPEFQRNVLEAMRQPFKNGSVTIARTVVSVTFPPGSCSPPP